MMICLYRYCNDVIKIKALYQYTEYNVSIDIVMLLYYKGSEYTSSHCRQKWSHRNSISTTEEWSRCQYEELCELVI